MDIETQKPILTPQVQYIELLPAPLTGKEECLLCEIDADGEEVANSEFVTSLRQYDKTYKNNPNFKLKKK